MVDMDYIFSDHCHGNTFDGRSPLENGKCTCKFEPHGIGVFPLLFVLILDMTQSYTGNTQITLLPELPPRAWNFSH